jgi:hypothetical protein
MRYCNVSLVGCFDDLILLIKGHEIIYIEDVLPSFYHNITCSLVRVTLFALVLGFLLFWSEAQLLGGLFFGKWCYLSLEGLQLGNG